MRPFIHLAVLLTLICASCSRKGSMDNTFANIDAMCDSDPRLAMSMLDSIDYGSLSTPDRHRYDLLNIKAHDKAYVRHTSDSLILDVIEYYQSHQKSGLYPEALYYGGRVYSDIGDLPTALTYFQQSIKAIPEDRRNLRFKRNVLDQTGRLLHSLRLDSAAVEYLAQSLTISDLLKDNDKRIAFTHSLLSSSYLNLHDIQNARRHIDHAIQLSSDIPSSRRASIQIRLSQVLDVEGKTDSALLIIRPLPSLVDSFALSKCLALASEIYRDAGILDTAYQYARQLTNLKDPSNKRTGYKVIFSDQLKQYVPKDTLISLLTEYKLCLEEYMNGHEGEQAILQNTKYNYAVHERERLKAEKKLYIYIIIAAVAVIISLVLLAWTLHRKFRKADTEANLMAAINVMKESHHSDTSDIEENNINVYPEENEKLSDIKRNILSGIKITDDRDTSSLVNPVILDSHIYITLKDKLESESSITNSEEKSVYKNLEDLIESVSAGFTYRLRVLTEGKITPSEGRMAMLMKCGFSPLQISILFGRGKTTISTHRRNLAFKITGQKKSDRTLDTIIISL